MADEVAIPYGFDPGGRTALIDEDRHVRDLIEQVLMTAPGERVNRPDFGAGVNRMLFGPANDVVAATAQFTIRGALQQWLSDKIVLTDVSVSAIDSTLTITVSYMNRLTQEKRSEVFSAGEAP
jgi:phage baseplate assembly protein W